MPINLDKIRCCVPGCQSVHGRGISFHVFPPDGSLSSWNTLCGFQPGEPVNPNRKVCGLHFRKTDFCRLGKGQTPTPGAIPSVKIRSSIAPKINSSTSLANNQVSGIPELVQQRNLISVKHHDHCYSVSPESAKRKR